MQPVFTRSTPEWISQFPDLSSGWDRHQNVLEGHKAPIETTAFSPDSTYMVSLSTDGNMRVWRLDTSECIREMWIKGIRLHPTIAITTEPMWICLKDYEEMYLWHGETAELVGQYPSFAKPQHEPCFSQCAQYCAFMDTSNHVVLLKLKSGSPPKRLRLDDSGMELDARDAGNIPFFVFSKDSKYLALYVNVSHGGSLVWDIASGACVKHYSNRTIPEPRRDEEIFYPISVMLRADHSIMVAFSPPDFKTQIQIQALPSGSSVQRFNGHKGYVETTVFLKEGKVLGSSCTENEIRTWNIETGQCLTRFVPFTARGVIRISPSYEIACSVVNTKTVSVVSYTPNERPSIADESDWEIERLILSDDKTLVAAIFKSDVRIWNIETGDSMFSIGNNHGNNHDQGFPDWPTITPNFKHIRFPLRGGEFFKLRGLVFSRFQASVEACSETATSPFSYTATSNRGIAISPDGSLIAMAYRDTTRISKLDTHVTTHTIQTPGRTHDLMFSSDSKLLTILSHESREPGRVHDKRSISYVFDIKKADMVQTIRLPGEIREIVDISPRLGLVVLLTKEYDTVNGLLIIDIKTKEVRHRVDIGTMVTCVKLNSSYTTCIWSSLGSDLEITNVSTGKRLAFMDVVNKLTRFNLAAGSNLVSTNIGDIQLDLHKRDICLDECNRVGLGLSEDMSWILWNNTKLFWLPPAIRPIGYQSYHETYCCEISGSTVVIPTTDRGVLFFYFNTECLP